MTAIRTFTASDERAMLRVMQRVHVTQEFPQSADEIFAYLNEQENLEPLFGAKIKRLSDGSDGTRNGVGASRKLRIGPLPGFIETNTEVIPNELIRYRITKGGVVKNHEGVMRFSRQGEGSRLDYTIVFDGKAPGIGALAKAVMTRNISTALRKLAERETVSAHRPR
jgi:carbon monoxide dehydrogenase subunit G